MAAPNSLACIVFRISLGAFHAAIVIGLSRASFCTARPLPLGEWVTATQGIGRNRRPLQPYCRRTTPARSASGGSMCVAYVYPNSKLDSFRTTSPNLSLLAVVILNVAPEPCALTCGI